MADGIRKLLKEGVEQIACLKGPCEAEVGAFNIFRKAVTQASSGISAPPSELLDNLEPKEDVIRFLCDFHERKRMYRKQIAAVMSILLETAWLAALQGDEDLQDYLPAELKTLLEDARQATVMDPASPSFVRPLPSMKGPGDDSPLKDFDKSAGTAGYEVGPEPAAPTAGDDNAKEMTVEMKAAVAKVLQVLVEAQKPMEKLDYSGASGDNAMDAFIQFRKSVQRVVKTSGAEGTIALDQLEPKGRVLEFLVDFYAHQKKYRSQVSALLLSLLGHEDWNEAVELDPSVRAAVRELTDDLSKPRKLTVVGVGMAVNLGGAAISALNRGGVGAIYVRVIAGYNIVGVDKHTKPDPYVKISIGGKMKRTHTICCNRDPFWDSSAFLLDVPSFEADIKFEVLDSDLIHDRLLGTLSMTAAKASTQPGFTKHKLEGVEHGELELELVYMPGEQQATTASVCSGLEAALEQMNSLPGKDGAEAKQQRGSFLVMVAGKPSATKSWVMQNATDKTLLGDDGRLRCPAGHLIEKKKENLRWHEGWTGTRHMSRCDLCGKDFARDETRWRCMFHCHFDVCNACKESCS